MTREPSALNEDPVIRDLEIMSAAVNYRNWIYRQFTPILGRRVIECGAGIGNFTELLAERELVVAVDSYGPCVSYLANRFRANARVVPVQMDVSSPRLRELERYQPDTIVCINVLEHVEDDRATLKNMRHLVGRGGAIALLVPAFPCLYGTIDRMLGHYRRYRREELAGKFEEAGLKVQRLFYFNAVAPFGWFVNNRVLKRTEESPVQVLVFDRWIVPWLSRIEHLCKPPYGLSLIVLAEAS